jgi:hypothetical protein
MKCVKYDHEFAQDLRDKTGGGTSQVETFLQTISIPRVIPRAGKGRKSTSAEVGGQESGSHVESDRAPGGSSMGLRRSTRQKLPKDYVESE